MNMQRYAAIIAEYNPLHNGHCHHITKTKQLNTDILIIILSGSFTQRGIPAILDKYTRAKHAIQSGADIVIELPTIFAVSNAEQFAKGAIMLLAPLKTERYLSFGSECGNINLLTNIKDIMADEPQEVSNNIKKYLKIHSFPHARAKAYSEYAMLNDIQIPDITSSNNMLAIEYLKAISALDKDIIPLTIKRKGADYNSLNYTDHFISSTAIRSCKDLMNIKDKLPKYVYKDLISTKKVDNSAIYLQRLQSMTAHEINNLYDVTEGLENRIKKLADNSVSYSEFFTQLQTKRYTTSRLQRIVTYALLNITKQMHRQATQSCPYYNILAIDSKHTNLLSTLRNYGKVYTTNQQLLASDNPLAHLDAKSYQLQRLFTEQNSPSGMLVIQKK